MKRIASLLLALLLALTSVVALVLPALAEDGDAPVLLISPAPATYTATLEDATFAASPDNADDAKTYYLTITTNAPAPALADVYYTVDGKIFEGAKEPGEYVVTAHLPEGKFVDKDGKPVTELTATLTLTVSELSTDIPGKPYAVILLSDGGFATGASVKSLAASVPADVLKKFAASDAMAFRVSGTKGASYTLLVPVSSVLYSAKSLGLNKNSLYRYEDGKLVTLAKEGYTVTLKEGYYEVTGIEGDAEMTLVVAAKRFVFPWWIIVIILVVALLVCMYFVGRANAKESEEETEQQETGSTEAKKE